MSGASDYAENKLCELLVGKTAFALPTVRVALFTTAPTDAGGGVEVAGGAYARKQTAAGDWIAAAGGAISNSADIVFPAATASWGNVVAFGLFDAATGGNLLAWAPLTVAKTVAQGDTAKFAVGDLDLSVA